MSNERIELLNDLVAMTTNLAELQNRLAQFPWDQKEPLVVITRNQLVMNIEATIKGHNSYDQLFEWANIVECRDDIEFESKSVLEVITELANPEINGIVGHSSLVHLKSKLLTYNKEGKI